MLLTLFENSHELRPSTLVLIWSVFNRATGGILLGVVARVLQDLPLLLKFLGQHNVAVESFVEGTPKVALLC